jgi:hypothetical protein
MMLQLHPAIPVYHEKHGTGYAVGWQDYSQEHHLIWIVAFDKTGEVWSVPNPEIRLQFNYTMGRVQ